MSAHEALLRASLVLFDFDGPLCDVFAGLPAPRVAADLSALCGEPQVSDDPLDVLRRAAMLGDEQLRIVEDALIAAEIEAVGVSTSEASGVELARLLLKSGRSVGIVSNNSAGALERFVTMHDLDHGVTPIIGRAYLKPDLMKPNPWPLRQALELARCAPRDAVFIGDTITDLQASVAADIACVAVANKPGKDEAFAPFGVPVAASMDALLTGVAASTGRHG